VQANIDKDRRLNYRVHNHDHLGCRNAEPWGGVRRKSVSSIKFEDIQLHGFTVGRFSRRNKHNAQLIRDVAFASQYHTLPREWPGKPDDGASRDEETDE